MKNVTVRIDRLDRGGPDGGGPPPVVREGPSLLRLRVTSSGLVRTRRADGSPAQWPGTWNRPCHTALVSRSGLRPRDHSLPARRWSASLRRPKYKNGPPKSGPFA